jgi:DNA polymerase elongation subunit (family B)
MRIVHEKTARRIILYNAKCYVLDKYESLYSVLSAFHRYLSPTDAGKLEIKGLFFNKRDCCTFARELGNDILEIMVSFQLSNTLTEYRLERGTLKELKSW